MLDRTLNQTWTRYSYDKSVFKFHFIMNGNSWWTDRQTNSSKEVCPSFFKGEQNKLSNFILNPFKMFKTLFIFSCLSNISEKTKKKLFFRVIMLLKTSVKQIMTHPSLSSTLAHKMSFPRSAPTGIQDTVIFAVRLVLNLISVWFVSRPPVLVTSNSSIFLFSEN